MEQKDRRMFKRFAVDLRAEIKHPGAQQGNFGRCCDVSAGGLGLFTQERLIPNVSIEIKLEMYNGQPPFCSQAKVVWSRQAQQGKWRSGLEFSTVDFMGVRSILERNKARP